MKIQFTKMQGAGNDFVVLDETKERLNLSAAQYRFLGDRHFGVGADQILSVRPPPSKEFDFSYAIHNSDGVEVEHCGNGARCFVRFVRSKGLTDKTSIRVKTSNRALTLVEQSDGRVTVDMGAPLFDLAPADFEPKFAKRCARLQDAQDSNFALWQLDDAIGGFAALAKVAVLSMGNPHAVMVVADVEAAPVQEVGARLQSHPAFANRVNVGFMQVLSATAVRLRVFERGAGETLACGTGACAAVVAGIRLGLLGEQVDVQAAGGLLGVQWLGRAQGLDASVWLSGPAVTVFEGAIELPN